MVVRARRDPAPAGARRRAASAGSPSCSRAVDAEDECAPRVLLLELLEEARRLGISGPARNPSVSIPIGSTPIPTRRPAHLDRVRLRVEPDDAQAGRAEVARVVADLEAHVVGAEEPAQDLLAQEEGGTPRTRGRAVQEEADREPGARRRSIAGTSIRWKSWIHTRRHPRVLEDRVGEALVDVDVSLPRLWGQPRRSPK